MPHHSNDANTEDSSNQAICSIAAILEHICSNVTANRALRSNRAQATIATVDMLTMSTWMPSWRGVCQL